MDDLINELLKQSPLVILMVVGYYVMLKEKKELKKEAIAERKALRKEIKDKDDLHAQEKKELYDYIRESDKSNQESINGIHVALAAIQVYISENKTE